MAKKKKNRKDVMIILAEKHKAGNPLGHYSSSQGPSKEVAEIEYGLITGRGLRAPKGPGGKAKEAAKPLPQKRKKLRKKKKKPIIVEFAELREKRNGR